MIWVGALPRALLLARPDNSKLAFQVKAHRQITPCSPVGYSDQGTHCWQSHFCKVLQEARIVRYQFALPFQPSMIHRLVKLG